MKQGCHFTWKPGKTCKFRNLKKPRKTRNFKQKPVSPGIFNINKNLTTLLKTFFFISLRLKLRLTISY